MSNFKIIRPFVPSDVALVSSTVPVLDPNAQDGAYNPATAYTTGQVIQVDSPTFTFTAVGYLMTAVNHGWGNNTICKASSSGTLPTGLSANVRYYIVQIALDHFKLSLTPGGVPISTTDAGTGTHTITVSSHRIYEALSAAAAGTTPHLNPTIWQVIGNTNRWKCLDLKTASQTYAADTLTYVLQTKNMIDAIYLGNVHADSVTITARESGGGAIVYGPTTYNLRRYVSTFWDWCFSTIDNVSEFTDIDLPAYADLEITVTLTKTGDTVKVGTLLCGLSKSIGVTSMGASFSIKDYSIKSTDEWGDTTFTERAYSKTANYQVKVERADVDIVGNELAKYRATPIVYVGTTAYDSAIIYGKFNSFTTTVAYESYSMCNIEIEGLT